MKAADQYRKDHFIAKVIVYCIYILVGVFSIETENPYFALTVGTQVWLFGVNTVGYIIETVAGHCHLHNKI